MGPFVTKAASRASKILYRYQDKRRCEISHRWQKFSIKSMTTGFLYGRLLFDKVTPNMRIYKEEIFGPVLSIVRVPDFASAIKISE